MTRRTEPQPITYSTVHSPFPVLIGTPVQRQGRWLRTDWNDFDGDIQLVAVGPDDHSRECLDTEYNSNCGYCRNDIDHTYTAHRSQISHDFGTRSIVH